MLDIRATHYPSPLSEVEFASVPLSVSLYNAADEPALVSGTFRVYNNNTGLLIHTSDITPLTLTAGASAVAPALTDFTPPAPADDTYFVVFDAIATNSLVPDGIGIHLGAFFFDVKPVGMGPAPAAHHPTHEDGGSDEINVTGLSGHLADAQDPTAHAATHADGGGDDVDHNTLTNLDVGDVHTQYRLRHEILLECDFIHEVTSGYNVYPWFTQAISAGFSTQTPAETDHPGILAFWSSVNANSGFYCATNVVAFLIAGGENTALWHRPLVLSGTTKHFGFIDTTTVSDPVDGVWIWQDPATGIIYGRTMNNSVGSTTGTGYQLVANTWYYEKIIINPGATRVDFYLYDATGALLWTDNLTTNIPTAAGRTLGNGVVITNSGTTQQKLAEVDFISALLPDQRPDV